MAPTIIIVGAGPSGIAMAYNIKHVTGIDSFTLYEQAEKPGGVWHLNTYPNCGCDVYSHLYSFSFNQNHKWSCELAGQAEIEQYMNDTIDKFELRAHIHCAISVVGASWNSEKQRWLVRFLDLKTKMDFTREADVFISCVGAISIPKECTIPGHETFTGTMWHSARWNHHYDTAGKTIAVVGNGCSASQFIPPLVGSGAEVVQYARSPQWFHPRPNHVYSTLQKSLLRWVPGLMRLYRLYLFVDTDNLLTTYLSGTAAQVVRDKVEADSIAYMEATAPKKYHNALKPDYPLGCKRRVFDPGYLASLHSPNLELICQGVTKIDGNKITSNDGQTREVDAIVLATGYKVQEFLTPLEIFGDQGRSLAEHWKETRGAQAYHGTFISHFPNFAVIFGPNSFPAHNSVIYTAEVQAEFTRKTLIEPLVDGRAKVICVTEAAEDLNAAKVQLGLKSMVWEAGCSNWYLNEWGRNTASYPGYASSYWFDTFFTQWQDFEVKGGSMFWRLHALNRLLRQNRSKLILLCLGLALSVPSVRHAALAMVANTLERVSSSAFKAIAAIKGRL